MKFNFDNIEIFDEPFKHVVYKNCLVGNEKRITAQALSLADEFKAKLVENENFSKIEIKSAPNECGNLLKFMSSQELANICAKHFLLTNLEPDALYDGEG